ncbi:hypothetical protein J6590_047389 [Homalodisca vitripennis]|nr:hypothetical protein J6590_047389 [Homalodisca vitripennis]
MPRRPTAPERTFKVTHVRLQTYEPPSTPIARNIQYTQDTSYLAVTRTLVAVWGSVERLTEYIGRSINDRNITAGDNGQTTVHCSCTRIPTSALYCAPSTVGDTDSNCIMWTQTELNTETLPSAFDIVTIHFDCICYKREPILKTESRHKWNERLKYKLTENIPRTSANLICINDISYEYSQRSNSLLKKTINQRFVFERLKSSELTENIPRTSENLVCINEKNLETNSGNLAEYFRSANKPRREPPIYFYNWKELDYHDWQNHVKLRDSVFSRSSTSGRNTADLTSHLPPIYQPGTDEQANVPKHIESATVSVTGTELGMWYWKYEFNSRELIYTGDDAKPDVTVTSQAYRVSYCLRHRELIYTGDGAKPDVTVTSQAYRVSYCLRHRYSLCKSVTELDSRELIYTGDDAKPDVTVTSQAYRVSYCLRHRYSLCKSVTELDSRELIYTGDDAKPDVTVTSQAYRVSYCLHTRELIYTGDGAKPDVTVTSQAYRVSYCLRHRYSLCKSVTGLCGFECRAGNRISTPTNIARTGILSPNKR